jgi:hypothetical protein
MELFQINKKIAISCRSERTRYGFRHLATLLYKGQEVDTDKRCYYNRTWERYEFESVMYGLVEKTNYLTDREKRICKKFIKGDEGVKRDMQGLGAIGAIAMMGDILCNNQKDKNDWKARMLKAGLEGKGLDMPTDWETLSEEEKTKRLDGAIATLTK